MTIVLNGTTGISTPGLSNSSTSTNTGNVTNSGTVTNASTISVGNATPSASGAGITFPATQSASTDANTLDDYEEGTFDPTFTSSGTTPTGITYTTQRGSFVKIGRMVFFNIVLNATWGNSPTGNFYITGLPFTPSDLDQTYGSLNFNYYGSVTFPGSGRTQLSGEIAISSNNIAVYACGSTGGGVACQITSNIASGFYIQAQGMYMAA